MDAEGSPVETRIEKSEREWREQLSPDQYAVLREKATERPFTGEYVYAKDAGVYRCAACDLELFDSNTKFESGASGAYPGPASAPEPFDPNTKFESGSGWPSFTDPANTENVELVEDRSHGMV